MDEKLETRDAILKAAMDRILHYGYAKTTMSEIARDCCMSAGNIYRFFASKLDIAEAMARKYANETSQRYGAIARDQKRTAKERLYDIFSSAMERTHELFEKEAKLLELAEVLAHERPIIAHEELTQERVHLVSILKDGVDNGEFRQLESPEFTAEMLQCATMKFRFPQYWTHLTLNQLQRELRGVFDLLMLALSPPEC